jgi:hypothetical protein
MNKRATFTTTLPLDRLDSESGPAYCAASNNLSCLPVAFRAGLVRWFGACKQEKESKESDRVPDDAAGVFLL